jgi:hypothetical protein
MVSYWYDRKSAVLVDAHNYCFNIQWHKYPTCIMEQLLQLIKSVSTMSYSATIKNAVPFFSGLHLQILLQQLTG